MKDFVAIDFETANFEQSSICSMGIVIVKDGRKLRAVDRGNTLACGRVFHILNTIAAEHQRPIGFRVRIVLAEDLLVDTHGLVKLITASEMIGAIIEICPAFVIQLRQSLLRAAVFANTNGFIIDL